ncbi:MAG: AMP-binding protein [candidate division WOR-3 bacterium]
MNMIEMLAKNARMYPADTAIVEVRPSVHVRKEITWAAFYERVNRLANGLVDRGITRTDKIFLMGKNSIHWLEAFFGVMATGAWVVPLNFRFTDDDIRYCANVAEPAAFIVEEEYKERIAAIRRDLLTVRSFISVAPCEGMEEMEKVMAESSPDPPGIKIDYADESALYFTSGTTGAPKPVLHRQMMLVGSAVNEAVNEQWSHEGSLLMMAPLYHLAIGHLLGAMLAGAHSILLVDKVTPKLILETVAAERVTTVFLLVPWAQDILEALDSGELKKEDYDLSCWRLYFMGAQPIPPMIVDRWKCPPRSQDGPVNILFVGGDFPRKGGDLLLDWAAKTGRRGWRLHLVTRSPIQSSGENIRVYSHLSPNDPELMRLYQEAHLFVLPTRGDCYSLAGIEAMAAGLPVILSKTGGTTDIIQDEVTGYLIPPGDANALTERLEYLLDHPEQRVRMGEAARRDAEDRFDVKHNIERTVEVIKRSLSGGAP